LTIVVSRVSDIFAAQRPVLIPFVTGGFPSIESTAHALPALERAGAAIIEIGFPYTDPIADGPVIAQSMHQSLLKGVTPRAIFDVVRRTRSRVKSALLAMVTDSIITRMGPERFIREAAEAGFDGLIVPDIDLDAAIPLAGLARLHHLTFTLLVAPTTTEDRIQRIVELCSGFVYVLARVGITGERSELDEHALEQRLTLIRRHTALPLGVGFGISDVQQVRRVARVADGVIVGSALVRRMEAADDASAVAAAEGFLRDLAPGLKRA